MILIELHCALNEEASMMINAERIRIIEPWKPGLPEAGSWVIMDNGAGHQVRETMQQIRRLAQIEMVCQKRNVTKMERGAEAEAWVRR